MGALNVTAARNGQSKFAGRSLVWSGQPFNAVVEYEEINERYQFLNNQREDLIKAKRAWKRLLPK